jgi:hypothetical protein
MMTTDRQEGLRKRKTEGWASQKAIPELPWQEENLNGEEAIETESTQGPTMETLMVIPLSPQQEGPNNSMTGKQVAKEESKLQKVVVRVTSGALMVRSSSYSYYFATVKPVLLP